MKTLTSNEKQKKQKIELININTPSELLKELGKVVEKSAFTPITILSNGSRVIIAFH